MSDSIPKSTTVPIFGAGVAATPAPLEADVIELFDQLRDRLMRYLFTFHLPVADCEEVIQEAFLALFRHLQRGRSRHNLRGWLFRVSHNLALKRYRQSRRDFSSLVDLEGTSEVEVADPAPNPETEFSNGETRERLQAVVRALPQQDRRCLALRAEGLRYREIAEILEISLGSVSISLERSLARLARANGRVS